jgi:hypothetical protein
LTIAATLEVFKERNIEEEIADAKAKRKVTEVSSEENDWRASVESYSDSQAILEKG